MANLTSGKIAEVLFENALDTYEHQDKLVDMCEFYQPDAGTLQNSGNIIHRPVAQHAPVISGWDLTGMEQDVIEETYPAQLEPAPFNDFVSLRADDLRDLTFWERRGKTAGMQQVTYLNQRIAERIRDHGSLFFKDGTETSGYDFVANAQAVMNERQGFDSGMRYFLLNDRDTLHFSQDLAARQTLQGRPEMVWNSGMLGQNIAGFDVYTCSFLPNLGGGASPTSMVDGANHVGRPTSGNVSTAGVVSNTDYRVFDVTVDDGTVFSVGDKVTIGSLESVGLADKTRTNQDMTFSVVDTGATRITVMPKPISTTDAVNLSLTERAYGNVSGSISDNDSVVRLNTDTAVKSNLFFDKMAVEVLGGTLPANLFSEFDGLKVMSERMKNGQTMYMVYDGNLTDLTFRFRVFTWWGITIVNPSMAGVAVRGA